MEPFYIPIAAGLAAGGLGLGLMRVRDVWRRRAGSLAPVASETLLRRVELRLEAVEGLQAALDARLEAQGTDEAAERRLQAMAGQILGLVRDKDASLDVALAGLDQLRARMRVLEQIGDPAEARALFERLGLRLEAVETAQARAGATLETRLAGLEGAPNPFAEVSGQLTRLYAQKDAAVETVFARLAPLEAKLGAVEGTLAARDPAAALERFGERLEAARMAQEAAVTALGDRLAGLENAPNPFVEISGQLTWLCAQKDATVEAVFARLGPLEARLAALERAEAADDGAAAARAEAQAIAAQLIAARTVAEETRLFASRIGLLEASLPRLSLAQALMLQALERQAAPAVAGPPEAALQGAPETAPETAPGAPAAGAESEEDALWRLPRVVSVHRS